MKTKLIIGLIILLVLVSGCVKINKKLMDNDLSPEMKEAIKNLREEFEKNPDLNLEEKIKELPNINISDWHYYLIDNDMYLDTPIIQYLSNNSYLIDEDLKGASFSNHSWIKVEIGFEDGFNQSIRKSIVDNLDSSEFQLEKISSDSSWFYGNLSKKGIIKLLDKPILAIHIYSLSHAM